MTETTAIMVCGPNNLVDEAAIEFDTLTRAIGERCSNFSIASGRMGQNEPALRQEIANLVNQGATKIVCVPGMLPTSHPTHIEISTEIDKIAIEHPNVSFIHSRDLAIDGKILAAARDRIEACEISAVSKIKFRFTREENRAYLA